MFTLTLSLTPLTVLPRDSDRAAGDLRGPLRARAVPSRPVLARNSGRGGALDRVHIGRLLSTRAQPRQLTDAQLCARRCRCRRRVLAWLLDRLGAQVVRWAHQADHPRYARPLHSGPILTLTTAGRERRDGRRYYRSSGCGRCRKAGILGKELIFESEESLLYVLHTRDVIISISFSLGPLVRFCDQTLGVTCKKGKRRLIRDL